MIWSYDIEVYSNFFSVTFRNYKSREIKQYVIYEDRNDLTELVDFIDNPHLWLAGYNNFNFDNQLLKYLWLTRRDNKSTKELLNELYSLTQQIINEDLREYMFRLPFKSLDLMKIGNLNQKSLKLVGTVMKWHRLQDLPIAPEEIIKPEDVELILDYNLNDVDITDKLLSLMEEPIRLRFDIAKEYNVDVYSESDSGIANRLLEKFYSESTGLDKRLFKKLRTHRKRIHFADVIMPDITFRTDTMMEFLDDLRKTIWYESVPFLKKSFILHGTKYIVGIGGLHSVDEGGLFEPNEKEEIIDADVNIPASV